MIYQLYRFSNKEWKFSHSVDIIQEEPIILDKKSFYVGCDIDGNYYLRRSIPTDNYCWMIDDILNGGDNELEQSFINEINKKCISYLRDSKLNKVI